MGWWCWGCCGDAGACVCFLFSTCCLLLPSIITYYTHHSQTTHGKQWQLATGNIDWQHLYFSNIIYYPTRLEIESRKLETGQGPGNESTIWREHLSLTTPEPTGTPTPSSHPHGMFHGQEEQKTHTHTVQTRIIEKNMTRKRQHLRQNPVTPQQRAASASASRGDTRGEQ